MKRIILTVTAIAGFAWINAAVAQKDKKEKIKTDEHQVIILKKGDKDTKLTIETKDGEVFINGKPMSEYKDDDITISKGKTWNLNDAEHLFDSKPFHFRHLFDSADHKKGAFLGVTTEKEDNKLKVIKVNKGSAAEKAGLKEGDVITRVGDKVVNTPEELSNAISAFKPKDEVKITFDRDGKSTEAKATLGERSIYRSFSFDGPGANGFQQLEKLRDLEGLKDMHIYRGGDLNDIKQFGLQAHGRAKLGIKIQDTEEGNGVKVVEVEAGSAAEKAGIKKDDILVEIGGEKVTNTDEAREELADNKDKTSYAVKVKRNGTEISLDVKPQKKLKTTNL